MNSNELTAFKQLQQCIGKLDAPKQLPGWVVRTGKQGVYYLHEDSSLSFHNLGAARVAVHAFKKNEQSDIIGTGHDDQEDDEDERTEILSLCSCLDGVIGQLHKQVKALESYQKEPQEFAQTSWEVQSKIVDMYDICACAQGKLDTDTGRHSFAEVNKAMLSAPDGNMCSVCPEAFAQIQLHLRVQTALHVYSLARAETYWCSVTCLSHAC